jgi:hypothetical protein
MKRNKKQLGEKLNPSQLRNAANDAIAFLHSMVKLVDARGWREVHFEFAQCILCTADTILDPDPGSRGERPRLDSNGHVSELFEEFERVPVPVFKSIISLIERELRKDVERAIETSEAKRAA